MKILHVINSLRTAGAERLVTEMVPVMKSMGHDVDVLLLQSYHSAFEKQLEHSGVKVTSLNLFGGRYNPLTPLFLVNRLRGYDVIHAHLFPTQYWVALASRLVRGRYVVVTTEHNTFNTRGRYALTSFIDRCFYSLYDGIVCISEATKKFMRLRVPESVPLTVIENGISVPQTSKRELIVRRADVLPELSENDFVVLQVARFQEQKNQDCLIRALQYLPRNVQVVFAGDGERIDTCKSLAEKLGVAERVHFLGVRNDIANLWKVADLGVMSSHWEGFGLAALEGMAYGKPVIASDVKGLADIVHYKELLFEPDNDKQLAGRIQSLMTDKELRQHMSELCVQRAQHYDIKTMVKHYIDFYNELFASKYKVSK